MVVNRCVIIIHAFLGLVLMYAASPASSLPTNTVMSFFDKFLMPYTEDSKYDAVVLTHFKGSKSSNSSEANLVYYKIIGNCYSKSGASLGAPSASNSLFRVGGLTKLFTTVAALQLYEQGLLDLDASVTKYVPELKRLLKYDIKVKDTMRHTVGIDERILGLYEQGRFNANISLTETIQEIWTEQLFPAGKRIVYSNMGLTILGAIIEQITKLRLINYLRTNIASPLGLNFIGFHVDLKGDFSKVCYSKQMADIEPFSIRSSSANELYISAIDMSTFLLALLNDGTGLFSKVSTLQMMTSRLYPESFNGGLAYMFSKQTYYNQTILSKDGYVFGTSSSAALFPDTSEGIFIVSTEGNGLSEASIEASGSPRTTLEESFKYKLISANYPKSLNQNFMFPVDDTISVDTLKSIAGSYHGSRKGWKSPLALSNIRPRRLYYTYGRIVDRGNYETEFFPAVINPALPSNQLLLQVNTSTNGPYEQHWLMLVTFNDEKRIAIVQIEDFKYLDTYVPVNSYWTFSLGIVLFFFACDIIFQIIAVIYFLLHWRRTPKPSRIAIHRVGLFLCLVSFASLASLISIYDASTPDLFMDIHPGFICYEVFAIFRIFLIYILAAYYLIMRIRTIIQVKDPDYDASQLEEVSIYVDGNTQQPKKIKRNFEKHEIIVWILFILLILSIPGLYALNLITFTFW